MFNRKYAMILITTVVICACLYDHSYAAKKKIIKPRDLARKLFDMTQAVKKNEILFTPLCIIFRFIEFVIRAVTFPARFIYRLVFHFMAVFGLLMLGCRIIPVTECPDGPVSRAAEEIMNGIREELEFMATMDAHVAS